MPPGAFRVLVCLLMIAACFGAGSASWAVPYQETPSLQQRVAEGSLPTIDQRLPAIPLVDDMKAEGKQPGKPGGTLRILIPQGSDSRSLVPFEYSRLIVYDDRYRLVPDILASFDVQDGRIFTFHLRPGHRWSDGAPFTSEDFRYYWEDVATNADLNPDGLPPSLIVNGTKPKVDIIDATTVRYSWAWPNQAFLPALAGAAPLIIYRPAHYLKQFNPNYSSKRAVSVLVMQAKLDDWTDLHRQKDDPLFLSNPDMPTLGPWISLTRPGSEAYVAVRNPYYHRVDKDGRQLPYIDRVMLIPQLKSEMLANVVSGRSDLQAQGLTLADLPALRDAAKKGTIKLDLWPSGRGSELALYPNQNAADPVWQALMRDVRFRRALSLSIDRNAINQQIYAGMAKPRANTLLPDSPLFEPDAQRAWSEFDLARAQELLDEIGLKLDDKYKIRRMPDGRLLSLLVATQGTDPSEVAVLRLIQESWRKVGVELMIGAPLPSQFHDRLIDGRTVMSIGDGLAEGLATAQMNPFELAPSSESQLQWPRWGLYMRTRGAKGDQIAVPEVLKLVELWRSWRDSPKDSDKASAWHQMVKIHADQVYTIGLVGEVPQPVAVNPKLRNIPERDFYNWEPGAYFGLYRPDSFWLDDKP